MITKKTTQEVYDKTIALVSPKKRDVVTLDQLTPGEVVSLWWIGHHKSSSYIPKYFKPIYAIDIVRQGKVFEKFGYLESMPERYKLTSKGQSLLDSYDWIIDSHRNKAGAFNSGRRLLSQKDISETLEVESGFSLPNGDVLPDEFISLDIETTGLDFKSGDRIIQLSATHVIDGVEAEYFDTYVQGTLAVDDFIQELTGITNQDLLNAPTLDQVRAEFVEFVGSHPIVGWNIKRFDIPFLTYFDFKFADNEVIDLMYISRRYDHGGINNSLTTVKRMTGVKSLAHNSLADARATALVGKLISNFTRRAPAKTGNGGSGKKSSLDGFDYHDDSPIFEGIRFVFTGRMENSKYTRKQMEAIVKMHGGVVTSSLSERVSYFITGVQVSPQLIDGVHSRKELKYMELCKRGVDIYKTDGQGFEQLLAEYKRTALS